MEEKSLKEIIRDSMRIKHTSLDDDIQRNIDTCLLDMKRVGVDDTANNQLINKACELYCKGQFDYQGKGDKYEASYEKLRDAMSITHEYARGDADV